MGAINVRTEAFQQEAGKHFPVVHGKDGTGNKEIVEIVNI